MLTHDAGCFSGSRWFNTARAEDLQHKAKTNWVVLGTLLVVEEDLNQREEKLKWSEGTSLAVQRVKILHFPGTKIPNAMRCSQKVKNKIRKNKNDGRSTLKGFQDALGPHPNKHKRSLGLRVWVWGLTWWMWYLRSLGLVQPWWEGGRWSLENSRGSPQSVDIEKKGWVWGEAQRKNQQELGP